LLAYALPPHTDVWYGIDRDAAYIVQRSLLHRGEHVIRAHEHLTRLVEDLLAEAAQAGDVRTDVAPGELASYCLHALAAAGDLASEAAVRRLVTVILAGLRPPR
jgi:signal transduction histidine kinase